MHQNYGRGAERPEGEGHRSEDRPRELTNDARNPGIDMHGLSMFPVRSHVISTNPSQPQPGPSRSPYHVDFNNPAQTAVMEPDVLAFARHIGARSAVLSFLPGTEHTKLILSRPFRLPVTHPDIRAIKFDQTVEFNLDKTGGNLHFHGVRGIELDVGRFAPWVEANELFIRPDGSYDAAGIVLGVKSRRSGQAPIEVRDFCQKALDTLNRLLTQTP